MADETATTATPAFTPAAVPGGVPNYAVTPSGDVTPPAARAAETENTPSSWTQYALDNAGDTALDDKDAAPPETDNEGGVAKPAPGADSAKDAAVAGTSDDEFAPILETLAKSGITVTDRAAFEAAYRENQAKAESQRVQAAEAQERETRRAATEQALEQNISALREQLAEQVATGEITQEGADRILAREDQNMRLSHENAQLQLAKFHGEVTSELARAQNSIPELGLADGAGSAFIEALVLSNSELTVRDLVPEFQKMANAISEKAIADFVAKGAKTEALTGGAATPLGAGGGNASGPNPAAGDGYVGGNWTNYILGGNRSL